MSKDASLFHKQVLGNGLRLLVSEDRRFQSVAWCLRLEGGSRDESASVSGHTHLLEHLLLKRTERKSPLQIAEQIDRLGDDCDAYTDSDSLCLSGSIPASEINTLLEFLAELLFESTLSEEDLETEREVVRQEILEATDDPGSATFEELMAKLWPGSSLGRPVFGSLETLGGVKSEDLKKRLAELLCGSRIILAFAGNIAQGELARKVEDLFGFLPTGQQALWQTPTFSSGQVFVPRSVNQVFCSWAAPWPSRSSKFQLPASVLAYLLGGSMSSRLFQKLREERGLAYDVSVSSESHLDVGALCLHVVVERSRLQETLQLMKSVVDEFALSGPTNDEFERAKVSFRAQIELEKDSLDCLLWRMVESECCWKRFKSAEEEIAELESLEYEQLVETRRRWLLNQRRVVALGGDVDGLECSQQLEPIIEGCVAA